MTAPEAANMSNKIALIADNIGQQLTALRIHPTFIEEFYLGILSRERRILRDISNILNSNNDAQITSSFILFRVLLDDFIRLLSVNSSQNMEEEIVKILADAHNHRFRNIKESVELNTNFYQGNNPSLFTQSKYEFEKATFSNNTAFDRFFADKPNFKFKKLTPIADVFERLQNDVNAKSNAHSYIVYKFLTQYVHYSNLAFYLDFNEEARRAEINQFEEILLYCYKMLLILFEYFSRTYTLVWNDTEITTYFNTHTIIV